MSTVKRNATGAYVPCKEMFKTRVLSVIEDWIKEAETNLPLDAVRRASGIFMVSPVNPKDPRALELTGAKALRIHIEGTPSKDIRVRWNTRKAEGCVFAPDGTSYPLSASLAEAVNVVIPDR